MDTESRFDRLEGKIDKLTDAVTKIVRVEEQLISNNRRLDKLEELAAKLEHDINNVANIARANSSVTKFADKLFWLIVAGGVSAAFFLLR
jgi:TolA-binding protein